MVSDRFPVASFVVHVPPERVFEIACATDPSLFRGDQRTRRTPENFFTSRSSGLLRAAAGQATYLLPPDQLRRFRGRTRLYYALGAYRGIAGEDPQFTVLPDAMDHIPSIRISPDFTGKTLDRGRLRDAPHDARYGAAGPALLWGGDLLAARPAVKSHSEEYDDGYPKDLWRGRAPEDPRDPPDRADPSDAALAREPEGFEDTPDARAFGRSTSNMESYGETYGGRCTSCARGAEANVEPAGYEDAPALRKAGLFGTHGGTAEAPRPGFGAPALDEPDGYEDAPHVARSGAHVQRFGSQQPVQEPDGYEDAPDAARRKHQRYGAPQAPSTAAQPSAAAPGSTPPGPTTGVDDGYESGDDPEGELGVEGEAVATDPNASPLTIRKKFEIILPALLLASGHDRYAAIDADSEFSNPSHPAYMKMHFGLHWGVAQFNQRSGALGRVLIACQRRDTLAFRQTFGNDADRLLQVTNASDPESRLASVGGAVLWQEPWLGRFRAAGRVPAFQAAQNEVAIEGSFDPNIGFAAALDLDTDRALGMLFDRSIDMGLIGARKWIIQAVSPIKTDTDRDKALAALGFSSLEAFQGTIVGLTAGSGFGPKTHAALLGKLKAAGAKSPFPIPDTKDMLDRMVAAARGRRFEQRIASLRNSPQYTDAVQPLW
jgi:hypothetical protein